MSIIADCVYDLKQKLSDNPDLNIVDNGIMKFLDEWRVIRNGFVQVRTPRISEAEHKRRLAIYNSCTRMADMVKLMGISRSNVKIWIDKQQLRDK